MNPDIETVVLIRHAVSAANRDPTLYLRMPDHAIPLCEPEKDERALASGALVASLDLDPSRVCSWSSTYLRCKQTEALVVGRAFPDEAEMVRYRESFLLREQDFGDWDGLSEEQIAERDPVHFAKRKLLSDHYGRFYFRYPNGESRADVVQRIAIFIGKIHRSRYTHHIVFLHGVTQRAFRMAWFNYPVSWFESEPNPENASVLVIRRDPATGRWAERYLAVGDRVV